jgi:hypothetical protein
MKGSGIGDDHSLGTPTLQRTLQILLDRKTCEIIIWQSAFAGSEKDDVLLA